MMELLGKWLIGVTAAAILCALADSLMPDGGVRRVGKLALGLVMLAAILRPLARLEVSSPAELWEGYQAQTAVWAQALEEEREQTMKTIIEQEFAAYIVDKAEKLGAVCTAQVTCQAGENGVFLPQTAVLSGRSIPEQREALAQVLEEELGIPRARQTVEAEEELP